MKRKKNYYETFPEPMDYQQITHTGYTGCDNGSRHLQKMKQPKEQIVFS